MSIQHTVVAVFIHVLNGTITICSQTNQAANNVDLNCNTTSQAVKHASATVINVYANPTVAGPMCIRMLLGLLQS